LPTTRQFDAALHVVETLRAAGHQAYFAGGCVRDLLLGREPKDYDVATSATPDLVLNLFPRTFAVGAHFGVVLVADGDEEGYGTTDVATSAQTAHIPMAVIPMRCATPPAPKRMSSAAISPSTVFCLTPHTPLATWRIPTSSASP